MRPKLEFLTDLCAPISKKEIATSSSTCRTHSYLNLLQKDSSFYDVMRKNFHSFRWDIIHNLSFATKFYGSWRSSDVQFLRSVVVEKDCYLLRRRMKSTHCVLRGKFNSPWKAKLCRLEKLKSCAGFQRLANFFKKLFESIRYGRVAFMSCMGDSEKFYWQQSEICA